MLTLTAGQRVKLTDLASSGPLTIEVTFQGSSKEYDTSCFLLGEREQLLSDDHLVFYNNPTSRDGGVRMGERTSHRQLLTLDVSRLEPQVKRLAITSTVDEHTFRDITSGSVRILQGPVPLAVFTCTGSMFQGERALILLEVYFKDVWRLGVLAQGFKGGLADLITHYGGEVDPSPPPSPPAPAEVKVNLSKITLAKDTSITLKKPPNFTARLIWTGAGDLDFYCFYVTEKGQSGKVYWNMRGSDQEAPFITLDQDAAVNHLVSQAEETIRIHRTGQLFAAYSAFHNGTGAFKKYEPHAVIQDGLGQEVRVPLLNKNTYSYWVAIAKVTFNKDGTYTVERVEKYSRRHYEMSPTLHENGKVTMNTGPIEFKPV